MENWTPLLMQWYDKYKRELPWRTGSPRDPYKVWVSEIMLQQTRVEAVKAYYTNWMEQFPDIPTLAAAEEEDVISRWQGLGYYSRARNLHTAVREVMEHYGGKVPETREEIRKLKGIGEYPAGAILSMAYGKRETAVDGNVLRVFARICNIKDNILSAKVKKEITELVKARQDAARPGDFNEALMDLGATVCIPGQPRCEVCPLVGVCLAKKEGKENEIPLRITKKEVPVEPITVFVVRAETFYLLHQRPSKGLLAGMWEFPNCAGEGEQGREALTALLSEMGVAIGNISRTLRKIKHVFSHKIWQMAVYTAEAATVTDESAQTAGAKQSHKTDPADCIAANPDAATLPPNWRWVPVTELADYNLAGPHNRILREVIQNRT